MKSSSLTRGLTRSVAFRYTVSYSLIFLLLIVLFTFAFSSFQYKFQWGRIWNYRKLFIDGFGNTLLVSIFSLLLSLCIGVIVGLMRASKVVFFRAASSIYVEVIRNTPLLVQILLFFYVVGTAIGFTNRYVSGVIIMSVFAGAYMAEIIRAGIESIEQTQIEVANSLGFSRRQTYRHIIFPQMVRRIIPPLTGQLVSLIKDSSLLSTISVREFTMSAKEVASVTFTNLESYFFLALGYLLITFPVSLISRWLEKRLSLEAGD